MGLHTHPSTPTPPHPHHSQTPPHPPVHTPPHSHPHSMPTPTLHAHTIHCHPSPPTLPPHPQAKAHEQRSRLQEEITLRSKVETDKVRGVRESQDARVQLRRAEMEGRLQRAEMLRSSALQDKIRKAQKEDAKVIWLSPISRPLSHAPSPVLPLPCPLCHLPSPMSPLSCSPATPPLPRPLSRSPSATPPPPSSSATPPLLQVSEIAFINALEAQNKRIEVMERHQGQEARLQDIKVGCEGVRV